MNFAEAMRGDAKLTRTENGAVVLSTTGDSRLDLFGTIGSLREADESRITTLFAERTHRTNYLLQKSRSTQETFGAASGKERLSEPSFAIWQRSIRKHSSQTLI